MTAPRVLLLSDPARADAADTTGKVRAEIQAHAELVGELPADNDPLPEDLAFDLAVVVGGDGTLIGQARRLADLDVSLVGINVGRLGFLAEFDVEDLARHAAIIFGPNPPVLEHMLLQASVLDSERGKTRNHLAINDCVISAGEPFRIIELRISIDGIEGPTLAGDGVIVATPIGSTAYNVSAGGPIVHPRLGAIVITPLAAHSLAFRPIVVRAESVLRIDILRANPGTALVQDGQVASSLEAGDAIEICRHDRTAHFVTNPDTTYWRILLDKLRWAAPPQYRDEYQKRQ